MADDYDSPWKEILEVYFPEFMVFSFPAAAAEIDWSRGFETLDKELAQVVQDAELGRRYADKLLKVFLIDGSEEWLLVHVEVQGKQDAGFPRRMFTYAYRLYDRYGREIASLAVLADTAPRWRPSRFEISRWGSRLGLVFPSVKLLDYASRQAELEAEDNPFATVVLAIWQHRRRATMSRPAIYASWRSRDDSMSAGCRNSGSSTCTGFSTGSCVCRTIWSCNTPMRSSRSRRV